MSAIEEEYVRMSTAQLAAEVVDLFIDWRKYPSRDNRLSKYQTAMRILREKLIQLDEEVEEILENEWPRLT